MLLPSGCAQGKRWGPLPSQDHSRWWSWMTARVPTSDAPCCLQALETPGIPTRRRRLLPASWAALFGRPRPWRACREERPGGTEQGENEGSGSWDHLPRASFRLVDPTMGWRGSPGNTVLPFCIDGPRYQNAWLWLELLATPRPASASLFPAGAPHHLLHRSCSILSQFT